MLDAAVRNAAVPIVGPVIMGDVAGVYLFGLLSVVAFKHMQVESFSRARWVGEKGISAWVVFVASLYTWWVSFDGRAC